MPSRFDASMARYLRALQRAFKHALSMRWALIDELLLGIITKVPVRGATHGPEASHELLQVAQ